MRSFLGYFWFLRPRNIMGASGQSSIGIITPVASTAPDDTLLISADLDLSFITEEKTRTDIQTIINQINAIPKRAMPENKQDENDELFLAYTLVDLTKLFFKLKILLSNVQISSRSLENQAIDTIQERLEKITQAIPTRLGQLAVEPTSLPVVAEPSLFTPIENGQTALAVLQENDFLSNPPMIVFPNGTVTVLDPPQEFSLLKPSTWFTNWGKRRCQFAEEFNEICASILLPSDLLFNASTLQEALNKIAQISPYFEKTNNSLQKLKELCTDKKPTYLRTLFGFLSGAKNTCHLIESCEDAITEAKKIAKTKQNKITEDLKEKLVSDFKQQCEKIFSALSSTEEQTLFTCLCEKIKRLNPDIFNQLNSEIASQSAKLFVEKLYECFDKKVNAFISIPNEKKLENLCNFCKQYGTKEQQTAIDFIVSLLNSNIALEPDDFRNRLNQAARVLSGEKFQEWIDKNLSDLFKTGQKCPDWLSKKFITKSEDDEIRKRVKAIISAFENAHFNKDKRILTLDNNKQYPFTEWENLFQFVTRYCSENEENERSQFLKNYHMTRALYFFNEMFLSDINNQLNNKTQMITALKESIKDLKPKETNISSRIINAIKAKGGKILCVFANQTNQTDMIAAQLRSIISVLPKYYQSSLDSLDLALQQYGELKKTPKQILDQTLEDFNKGNFPVSQTDQEAQKKSLEIAYRFVKNHTEDGSTSTSYRNQYQQVLLCIMIDRDADSERKNFVMQLLEKFDCKLNTTNTDIQAGCWSRLLALPFELNQLKDTSTMPQNIKNCIDSVIKERPDTNGQLQKQYLIPEFIKQHLMSEACCVLRDFNTNTNTNTLNNEVFTKIKTTLRDLHVDVSNIKPGDTKSLVNAIASCSDTVLVLRNDVENALKKMIKTMELYVSKNILNDNQFSNLSDSMKKFILDVIVNKQSKPVYFTPRYYFQSNPCNRQYDFLLKNNIPNNIKYTYYLFLKIATEVFLSNINNSSSNEQKKTLYVFIQNILKEIGTQYRENYNYNHKNAKIKNANIEFFTTIKNTEDYIAQLLGNHRCGTPVSPGSNNTSPTGTPINNGSNSSLASKPAVAAAEKPPLSAPESVAVSSGFWKGIQNVVGGVSSAAQGVSSSAQNVYNSLLSENNKPR